MKEKKPQYNRAQRRELEKINERFGTIMDQYLHYRALYGNTLLVKDYRIACDSKWRDFCAKHNASGKRRMKADEEAFHNALNSKFQIEKAAAIGRKKQQEDQAYARWLRKVTLIFPKLMWKWKLINKFTRKDYVKAKYEKYEGQSPRGYWL